MLVMLLVMILLLGAVPAAAFAGFADVPADAWYAPAVQTCAEKGLFQGTSPTTFSPELSMTRGMFVTVLGRMENIDPTQADASGFMDVPEDAYYAGYVGWAARSGIVAGVSDSVFEPERGISRQEICTIVHRYLVWKDVSLQTVPSAQFADDAQIAELTAQVMWYVGPFYVVYSLYDNIAGTIRGAGESLRPMLIVLTGSCLLRIVWQLAIVPLDHTLHMAMLSYPITWVTTGIAFIFYYRFGHWMDHAHERKEANLAA